MIAKEKHRLKLLEFMSNPENDIPPRGTLANDVLGMGKTSLYKFFTTDELRAIEAEALTARRARVAGKSIKIDWALYMKAVTGDVPAIKLWYQRIEGWSEKQQHEVSGGGGDIIVRVVNYADLENDSE